MDAPKTPLDHAHAIMVAQPNDDAARLKFYERLADSELILMLAQDPMGDAVAPDVFEVQDTRFVLAFDREERLTQFAGRAVPYAAMSGRVLARLAVEQDLGLGLNLDVAPSAILLPPQALVWLVETLDRAPRETQATPQAVHPPRDLPANLLDALDTKLATAQGLARCAYLAGVTYDTGGVGHLLGFVGTRPGAERALAGAVNEALVFSGLDAGQLDVTFLEDADPLAAELSRVALRFDLPEPDTAKSLHPSAPGTDPDKPPKLR